MMNRWRAYIYFIFGVLTLGGFLFSCQYQDNYYTGENFIIEFSRDTVRFDTVFTSVGSATRSFKIKNKGSQDLLISRVALEMGDQSFFRLNVNGRDGNDIENVEIRGEDSIYVFVEVTINPDQPLSVSPFIIEEKVRVEVNSQSEEVHVEAWGQNANYVPSNTNKGGLALLSCSLQTVTWDDPKPYVVYGILLIDSCTLVLPPSCKVYVHGGIAIRDDLGTYNDGRIIVLKDGTLISNGTIEEPVIIQGDRLEPEYAQVSAQWTGIQIFAESKGNIFRNTHVIDGITGLSIDSAATAIIDGSQFYNHASRALVTLHPENVVIVNSLFHSTSSETVLLKYGGNISINYSTIASYSSLKAGLYADNFRCTDPIFCFPVLVNPLSLKMRNTIVSGNGSDELELVDITDKMEPGVLTFEMNNCLIKMDTLLNSQNYPNFFDKCINCASIKSNLPLFADADMADFHLDTLSQAEMKALPISGITIDLQGNARDNVNPDVGCYEYHY